MSSAALKPVNNVISIADLLEDRRTIDIAFGAATIRVTYQPRRITPAWTMQPDEGGAAAANVAQVCDLAIDWDMGGPLHALDGKEIVAAGEVVPIKRDIVRFVPAVVIARIVDAINSDARGLVAGTSPKSA